MCPLTPTTRVVRHAPVLSCQEAARARGVPLEQELKTLILSVSTFAVAAHITGDKRLNLRAVKQLFHVRDVRFLSRAILGIHGLAAGTVNPWNVNFCRYNLLCRTVLERPQMTTNNSSLCEGVFFDPHDLLSLPSLVLGLFGK
jgi:hypothetical protein